MVATLKAARGRAQKKGEDHGLEPWPETLTIGDGASALDCDSLELLWLSAAVNEMFHLHEAGLETELLRNRSFGDWLDTVEAAWTSGVTALTFATSGSTGNAKYCSHTFSYLSQEVEFLAREFVAARRIVASSPAHHLYGFLFTAMLPDRLDIPVVTGPQQPAYAGHDLIVAVPEVWRWLDHTVHEWPESVEGVVSGAPSDPEVLASLMRHGLARITEVYGSSETSGVGIRRWPEKGYRLMPQWSPADISDPTCGSLLHSTGVEMSLMDRIAWSQDGTFEILGRLDGAVQVGGVNVFPERIAAKLRERPGVQSAEVKLLPAARGGRLEAIVVLHHDAREEQLRSELEAWMKLHFSVAEEPKLLTFVRVDGTAMPVCQNVSGRQAAEDA
jgi:4-coumarate--CoA ligase (photoactive yellow protein activation family)